MKSKLVVLTVVFLSLNLYANDDKKNIQSGLKSVTVFRTGAELIHNATAQLSQGNMDITIEGISNQVDISSIQINCPGSVTIMSVEFSNNYLQNEVTTPRLRLLHDSLDLTQNELDRIMVSITTITDL